MPRAGTTGPEPHGGRPRVRQAGKTGRVREVRNMEIEEFRREAHRLVDWMADYLEKVRDYPVKPRVRPGEILEKLPGEPPERGEPFPEIFADFREVVLPGITHWQHPSFFAYFPANSSPPSVLA